MTAERVFDEYHEAVFRFVYRLVRCAATAEDTTQECFLAYMCAPHRWDPARGTLKTYLFSIARNLAARRYRDTRPESPLGPESLPPVTNACPDQELAAIVEQAVSALPELQKEALILFEYEGFTLEEIANVVGVDTGTVKSRLHRARQRLKRTLAPCRKVNHVNGAA